MEPNDLSALEGRYVMQTYKRAPVQFVRGEGSRLWDAEGKEYLDFLGGISVCSIGHCHPAVVEALCEQAGELMHVSNLFYSEPMVRLAERLSESSLGGRVFFTNSGTEANECAIKIARKHARARGIEQPEIISFDRDFHGRSYGALSATPALAANPDFAPMLPGFRSVPITAEAVADAVGDRTAAVLIEPIQGEAGVYPVPDAVLIAAREACDRVGALLILDEIQTGMGRTGSLWAYEQTPVVPDVMTSAKALGGGLPIGACITTPKTGEVLTPGDHGSTFAGGPLIAAAALAVLGVVDDPKLLGQVHERSSELRASLNGLPGVRELRGRGLMIGIGLEEGVSAPDVGAALLQAGLIVNSPEPSTLRLLPPLNLTAAEADTGVELIAKCLPPHHPQ